MLDIKLIREDTEEVKKKIARKGLDARFIDEVIMLDKNRRRIQADVERAQGILKSKSEQIAKLHGQQKIDQINEASQYSLKIKNLKPELEKANEEYNTAMLALPNLPADDVIDGKSDKDNTVNRKWGEPPKFDFKPLSYLELGAKLDLIDLERAGKVSGSRSYYTKNELVLLEFAIFQYALEVLTAEGFVPMIVPVLLNRDIMVGGGYIPSGEDEIYKTQDEKYLAGTAEQPLLGYHKDEVLADKMPLRYVGFSPCFRREAGSYGKDVRGILRVHQFDKLEMFSYTKPSQSEKEHEFLVSLEEKLMQGLGLPYQVINICAGDLGAPASKKYDIEAWVPSEGRYRETHSCSNCTDFQARRMNIRFRGDEGKTEFAHTLNGTAFALPRLFISIMENYQTKEGAIEIPEVLQKYLPFKKIG